MKDFKPKRYKYDVEEDWELFKYFVPIMVISFVVGFLILWRIFI